MVAGHPGCEGDAVLRNGHCGTAVAVIDGWL
jgi:hypothetical protein